MPHANRRQFLNRAAAGVAGWTLANSALAGNAANHPGGNLHIAPFRFDVTPPNGHPCCGGWIKPVEAVDDPLEAIGFVLLGAGRPIVIAAVDWTGLLNEAYSAWCAALAEAAGTTADRVAVQCVHQHNAPFACLEATRIVRAQGDLPDIVALDFFERCLDRARESVAQALRRARPVTALATAQAEVHEVASNRRVYRDEQGRVLSMRGSSCKDEKLRALPEGLIDPWLKTVAFFDGDTKVAACHYYATHPMSYYGDGRVSSDFVGLARKRRQAEEPNCTHIYFTGCAGNIAAGKYNDGSQPVRAVLADRVYQAIVEADARLMPAAIGPVAWKTAGLLPPARTGLSVQELERQIADKSAALVQRSRPSFQLSWLRRLERRTPILLSALHLGRVRLLHLPAESFVEYQLRAQQLRPDCFVATAAYGDGGPWYIPTKEEYPNGGYEVSVAFCDPAVDDLITRAIEQLT